MLVMTVGKEFLNIEPRREVLRLSPAVAGARLSLEFVVGTSVPNPTVSAGTFHFAAELSVSRIRSQNERFVCHLVAKHHVTPTPQGAHLTMAGFIGNDQLRAIEELRSGNDLVLHLELTATTVTSTPHLQLHHGDVHVDVRADEWAREIERVDQGTYVEVLVPMPQSTTLALAVKRVGEARDLVRAGEIDSALGKARLALEAVREQHGTAKIKQNAPDQARQRNHEERTAVLVEAAYSLICGALHDDEITKTFVYTRTEAITLIATVAGLVRAAAEKA
jgi:hypothetical protein